ncbi:MAG: DUF1874 domain-containing protein [Sphaerochaetaceae bacterium]|jgi:hypothetical protein|nr:DUF1874 domain-containing protein [Sphaerochaetaceae bacterium]
MIYLTTKFSLEMLGKRSSAKIRRITEKEFKRFLTKEFISIIDNEKDIKLLSNHFNTKIHFNRQELSPQFRDIIIIAEPKIEKECYELNFFIIRIG